MSEGNSEAFPNKSMIPYLCKRNQKEIKGEMF